MLCFFLKLFLKLLVQKKVMSSVRLKKTVSYVKILLLIAITMQTHHLYSTLKRHGNGHFHVVSTWNTRDVFYFMKKTGTAWEVSRYISVFSRNMGKHGPEKTTYLDTFHKVRTLKVLHEWIVGYNIWKLTWSCLFFTTLWLKKKIYCQIKVVLTVYLVLYITAMVIQIYN